MVAEKLFKFIYAKDLLFENKKKLNDKCIPVFKCKRDEYLEI